MVLQYFSPGYHDNKFLEMCQRYFKGLNSLKVNAVQLHRKAMRAEARSKKGKNHIRGGLPLGELGDGSVGNRFTHKHEDLSL